MSSLFNLNLRRYSQEIQRHHNRSFLIKHELLLVPELKAHSFTSELVKNGIKFDQLCLNLLSTSDTASSDIIEAGKLLVSQKQVANDVFYARRYLIFYWYFKLSNINFSESKSLETWFASTAVAFELPVLKSPVTIGKAEKELINNILKGDIVKSDELQKLKVYDQVRAYLDPALMELLTLIMELHMQMTAKKLSLAILIDSLRKLSSRVRVSPHLFDYTKIDALLAQRIEASASDVTQQVINNISLDGPMYKKLSRSHQVLLKIRNSIERKNQDQENAAFIACLQHDYPWNSLQQWVNKQTGVAVKIGADQAYDDFGTQLYRLIETISKVPIFETLDVEANINQDLKKLILFFRSLGAKKKVFMERLRLLKGFSEQFDNALRQRWKDHQYVLYVTQLLVEPAKMKNQQYPELLLAKAILLNQRTDSQLRNICYDDWLKVPFQLAQAIHAKMENEQVLDLRQGRSERFSSHWFELQDFFKNKTIEESNVIARACFAYLNGDLEAGSLLSNVNLFDDNVQEALSLRGLNMLVADLPTLIASAENESDSERYLSVFFELKPQAKFDDISVLLTALTSPKLRVIPFRQMVNYLHSEALLLHQFLSQVLITNPGEQSQDWVDVCAKLLPYQSVLACLEKNWRSETLLHLESRVIDLESVAQVNTVLAFSAVIGIQLDRQYLPKALQGLDSIVECLRSDAEVYYGGWLDGNVDVMVMIQVLSRYRHEVSDDELSVFKYYFSDLFGGLSTFYSQLDVILEKLPQVINWITPQSSEFKKTFLHDLRQLIANMMQFRREYELHSQALLSNDLAVSLNAWVSQNLPSVLRDEQYLTEFDSQLKIRNFRSGFYTENMESNLVNLSAILARPIYKIVLGESSVKAVENLVNFLECIMPKLTCLSSLNAYIRREALLGISGFNVRKKDLQESRLTESAALSQKINDMLDTHITSSSTDASKMNVSKMSVF